MSMNDYNDDPNAEKFRKLFIGGLNNETTEESLRQYFEAFGEVVDCVVMKNPSNNRSRGFGFVTYQSAAELDKAQAQRPHMLDKKSLDTKRAMPRDGSEDTQASVKKMFVGGLEETTSEEEILDLFSPYGRIEKVEMIIDKATGKQKRFCFVTFDDFDCVDKCVIRKRFPLGEKSIEVKKAVSKTEVGSRGGGGGRFGGRGGGGGGYGNNWGSNQGNYNNGGYYQGSDGRYGNHDYNNGYGSGFGSNYGSGSYGGAQRQGNFSHRNSGGPYGGGYGRGGGNMGGYRR